jgi:hypothetical protein
MFGRTKVGVRFSRASQIVPPQSLTYQVLHVFAPSQRVYRAQHYLDDQDFGHWENPRPWQTHPVPRKSPRPVLEIFFLGFLQEFWMVHPSCRGLFHDMKKRIAHVRFIDKLAVWSDIE